MELNRYIENTLLKPDVTGEELEKLFEESIDNKFYGVCINPAYVKDATEKVQKYGVKVVTVIGFPLGANTTDVKVFEAEKAISDGADEIDMVMNITKLKNKDYDYVIKDIKSVKDVCGDKNLKVILETDLLTKDEIGTACELCIKSGADFVKTSTGFVKNGVGAKAEDVKLMAETVKPHGLRVKASGGIRDKKTAIELIESGADRLGTSSGVKIVRE